MTTDYYARTLGEASNSALTEFRKSPLEYKLWCEGKDKRATAGMNLGTAFHMALHEPARFARKYVTIPDINLRSVKDKGLFLDVTLGELAGIQDFDESLFEMKADKLRDFVAGELAKLGVYTLTRDDLDTMQNMVESLNKPHHRAIRAIVARGQKELEIRWTDDGSGVQCKARLDSWDEELGIESDLKRTQAIRERDFRRTALNFDYCYQRAFYRRGLRAKGLDVKYQCFTCGSPDGPAYLWAAYDIPEEVIEACDSRITANLMSLAECLRENKWPTINNGEPRTLDIKEEWI